MARLILLFAFSISTLITAALWYIKTSVDRKCSSFPMDLPERPQKATKSGLRLRLAQKLNPSKATRTKSSHVSLQFQPDSFTSPAFVPSTSIADDISHPHVLTHYVSAPKLPQPDIERAASSQPHGLGPRLRKAASTFKLSKIGTSKNDVPFESLLEEDSSIFSAPATLQSSPIIIRRKPVPIRNVVYQDPLVERFERLKLPQKIKPQLGPFAPAEPPRSPRCAKSSPPLQSQAGQLSWNKKAMSHSTLPEFEEEPAMLRTQYQTDHQSQVPSRPGQGAELSTMTDLDDDSVDLGHVTTPTTNPFRHRMQAHKRALSLPRHKNSSNARNCRRRTRSPSSSEDDPTPDSSQDVSYPHLSSGVAEAETLERSASTEHDKPRFLDSTDASLLQVELDRRLAQRLHQEEEEYYHTIRPFWGNLDAAHQPPWLRRGRSTKRARSALAASTQSGTQENPINLDSDTDTDSEDSEQVIYTGRDGFAVVATGLTDPMDLDDDNWGWDCGTHAYLEADMNATLARILQEEEDINPQAPRATRECAVCGDQAPISERPSLAQCEHAPRTCAGCYADWVTAQLEGSSWKEAKCPESGCRTILTYYEIRQVATTSTFEKYDMFIARAAISEDRKSQSRKYPPSER